MADRRELLLRAVGAGALVAIVVTASETVGSSITGIAMLFPVILVTIGWIMQSRYGAEQAILVMTGALIALPGFGLSIMTLYLLAENRRARCTGHLPPHVAVLGCSHSLVSSNGLALAGSKWESSLSPGAEVIGIRFGQTRTIIARKTTGAKGSYASCSTGPCVIGSGWSESHGQRRTDHNPKPIHAEGYHAAARGRR
jgi:uncharacterized membrane protein (GlpM family)